MVGCGLTYHMRDVHVTSKLMYAYFTSQFLLALTMSR